MSFKSLCGIVACRSLALAGMGTSVAQASDSSPNPICAEAAQNQPMPQSEPKVTPNGFVQGLNDFVEEDKIKLVSPEESTFGTSKVYGIVDPDSGNIFMTFATNIPKYKDRTGGEVWGWEPALTFNQTDQSAIAAGGAGAVTAMAAAAAGGAATVYISNYGHCPKSRTTLWVGTITRKEECR